MSAKIYQLDGNEGDILDTICEHSQPVFVYEYYGEDDYIVISDKEIDDDDLEAVAEELIRQLEEEDEDDFQEN